ncbi:MULTISPECIES: hypothetical protein [Pseudanabaena]|uniref:Uncharacterized protein n=2 Tax=Pseudanabaena TaxID=1152 RepID=L8MZM5_9CYAN|nr:MULTISPECIES: hypothetical protein [Pseudanabaena]ELS31443.1 hypothetical protein Pse7429DRAFT_3474 [Pseudanabaena biceps PCC 7429]MDG3496302.1 hypothetical protein [Pseudanabaena catenata USMAC16]
MKKAFLIIDNSHRVLIDAEDVKHSDFSKIFQCPECNATLHWRSGFTRNGSLVNPAFIHPNGNLDDCSLRVDFYINSKKELSILDNSSRGQKRKKLEASFLQCLHHYQSNNISEIYSFEHYLYSLNLKNNYNLLAAIIFLNEESLHRQISVNSRINKVHPDPFLLIQAASKVIELSQSYRYIKSKIIDFEKQLLSQPCYMDYVIFKNEQTNKNISVQDLIKTHSQELEGIFKYIQSSSYEMKRDFLAEIIWGDLQLPLNIDSIWNPVEISAIRECFGLNILEDIQKIKLRRETGIRNISCFSVDMLKELCKDPLLSNKSFSDNSFFHSFIEFILLKIWDSIKFYDWSSLPEFYS